MLEAREKMMEIASYVENADWTDYKVEKDVQMYTSYIDGFATTCLKRVMTINANVDKVTDFFMNFDNVQKVDPKIIDFKVVEEIGKNTHLLWQLFEGNFFISNRDFSFMSHSVTLTDGSIYKVNYSVEHEKTPEISGNVRAAFSKSLILVNNHLNCPSTPKIF